MEQEQDLEVSVPVKAAVLGYNRQLYDNLKSQQLRPSGSTETILIFYEDGTSEIIDLSEFDYDDIVKEVDYFNSNYHLRELGDNYKAYFTDSSQFQKYLKKAQTKPKSNHAKKALVAAGIIGAAALAGVGGYHLAKALGKDNNVETNSQDENDNELIQEEGYGFYKYDLSNMEDINQYMSEIPDSLQKDGALLRLNILQNFNHEITLVDEETKQLGGLTIEQLVALDAYANSNIYTKEDYVKNFGIYDFSNVTSDFQQTVLQTSAFLANKTVDGTSLADIFKDEQVKKIYLKSLEYRDSILNAEDKKNQKKAVNEFEEFLASQSDSTSEYYIDYSGHPGMAFVTPVIVGSLDYNNIGLSSEIVSKHLIIGTDEHRSAVDTICALAEEKMDSVIHFMDEMEQILVDNQTLKVYNDNEKMKAESENRNPVLLQLREAELDDLISNTLCDQMQIHQLINTELEKTNQLVTEEDQKIVFANATNLHNQFSENRYKDAQTAAIAKELNEKGTATVKQEDVKIDTEAEKKDLVQSAPQQVEEAKQELNQSQGLLPNETPEEQKATQQQIEQDVADTKAEGENYYNSVVAYYEANGNVDGIPSNLQNAYNNLGDATYNLAKQTGIGRWTAKNQPTVGGEVTMNPEFKDVDTNATPQPQAQTQTQSNESGVESTQSDANQSADVEQSAPEVNQNQTVEQPSTPQQSDNTVTPDSNSSELGGEVTINPELDGVDIGDISTDPNPTSEIAGTVAEPVAQSFDLDQYLANMTEEEWNAIFANTSAETEISGPTK